MKIAALCARLDKLKLSSFLRSRYLLAVIAGIIYTAAFPKIGIAGLAWVAPGLILFAARGTSGRQAFKIGWLAGFSGWMVMLYWLLFIPYRWMGIPFGPALGWVVLSAFLGLYTGIWVLLCQRIQSLRFNVQGSTWLQRASWALLCAILWVTMEMIQARFLSGFPWMLLGTSQHKMTPLIQIASVTGVYGVGFVIVWFSVSLLNAINVLINKPTSYRSLMAEVFLPLLVVVSLVTWGFSRITRSITADGSVPRTIRIALVQPSIPQEVIWDEGAIPERFEQLMRVSEAALIEKPDLLVWPEAAMPGFSVEHFTAITNMIVQNKVWMILGADDAERKLEGGLDDLDFFNASFLFNPEGDYVASYRKLRLVMFGEYVPFTRWLPFLRWFTPVQGGFTPGKGPVQFQMSELGAQTTVLICFEDVFPHHTRRYVEGDSDFLLNLTNDGWFGRSAAQWQHAMTALFRAVENGTPLVRCTNNGLTCWIDEFGRLREFLGQKTGDVYSAGYLICKVPAGKKYERTFYNRHGDWFGWACVATGLLTFTPLLVRRRKP
ncbi:MAG: apolipoprotein N-acyltransferase [Verrucomicrobia bacterium]|nr:apolipoprotein N-acyltransferase [Verrucomicrobiota bacterium]